MDGGTTNRFGREVQAHRKARGWTQAHLAERMAFSQAHVNRIESGVRGPTVDVVKACDRVFGTPDSFKRLREMLIEDGHASWFAGYMALERQATYIEDYSNALVMGLLQTEDYAREVYRAANPGESEAALDERIAARQARRELLARATRPFLWCVLHENCLRTVVGGRKIMIEQLSSVLEDMRSHTVNIQVLPCDGGTPPSTQAFILLTQPDRSRVLYSEALGGGRLDDSVASVSDASYLYDRLRAMALSEHASEAFIRSVLKGFQHG